MGDIGTCVESLLEPGVCCLVGCRGEATRATLTGGGADELLVEHAVCSAHAKTGTWLAVKVIEAWDPAWGSAERP